MSSDQFVNPSVMFNLATTIIVKLDDRRSWFAVLKKEQANANIRVALMNVLRKKMYTMEHQPNLNALEVVPRKNT